MEWGSGDIFQLPAFSRVWEEFLSWGSRPGATFSIPKGPQAVSSISLLSLGTDGRRGGLWGQEDSLNEPATVYVTSPGPLMIRKRSFWDPWQSLAVYKVRKKYSNSGSHAHPQMIGTLFPEIFSTTFYPKVPGSSVVFRKTMGQH